MPVPYRISTKKGQVGMMYDTVQLTYACELACLFPVLPVLSARVGQPNNPVVVWWGSVEANEPNYLTLETNYHPYGHRLYQRPEPSSASVANGTNFSQHLLELPTTVPSFYCLKNQTLLSRSLEIFNMPKGLAFLSKKSWHTSKLCNQEKVWIAEQEKEAEEIKMKELAQQIKQEREEEELNRISGKKTNRLDRGIDWMYQGGGVRDSGDGKSTAFEEEQKSKEQEDYLMGKEFNPSDVKKGDLASAADSSAGVNFVLTRAAESSANTTVHDSNWTERSDAQDWNSDFHLRHEDPMFLVEQQRKEKELDKEKKERLIASVNDDDYDNSRRRRDRDRDHDRNKDRSDRKRRKSNRNRRSRRDNDVDTDRRGREKRTKEGRYEDHSRRSYSSESDESRRRRRDRKRRHRSRRRERSTSRSQSRSRSPTSRRTRDCRLSERSIKKSDERSRRDRSHSRSLGRSKSIDRFSHEDRESRSRRYGDDKETNRDRASVGDIAIGRTYGLVGSSGAEATYSDLGPDQSLLKKKRQEKGDARSRYISTSARGNRNSKLAMSATEREDALKTMQSDASARSGYISTVKRSSNAELLEEEIQRRQEGNGSGRSFP